MFPIPNLITAQKDDTKVLPFKCLTCGDTQECIITFLKFDSIAQVVWMSKECTACQKRATWKGRVPNLKISGTMDAFDFHKLWYRKLD